MCDALQRTVSALPFPPPRRRTSGIPMIAHIVWFCLHDRRGETQASQYMSKLPQFRFSRIATFAFISSRKESSGAFSRPAFVSQRDRPVDAGAISKAVNYRGEPLKYEKTCEK